MRVFGLSLYPRALGFSKDIFNFSLSHIGCTLRTFERRSLMLFNANLAFYRFYVSGMSDSVCSFLLIGIFKFFIFVFWTFRLSSTEYPEVGI